MDLKSLIRTVPDFPKKGVSFKDINPVLSNAAALAYIASQFAKKINMRNVEYIAGIESRGFILASLLAGHCQKGFLPIRKAGKLPPPVVHKKYELEYGSAAIEMIPGRGKIVIIDDVLATGGTLRAAIEVAELAGFEVEEVAVLINLKFLNRMSFKDREVISLVQYE